MVTMIEMVSTLLAVAVGMGVLMYMVLVKGGRRRGGCSGTARLPPGREGLPFVGDTWEFFRCLEGNRMSEFVERRRAKYGGAEVFRTSIFSQSVVVMAGAEANRFLFTCEDKLVKDWFPKHFLQVVGHNMLMAQSGQHHRHLRRLIMQSLSPEALQGFVPTVDRLTQQHLVNHWLPTAAQPAPYNRLRAFSLLQTHMLEVAAALVLGVYDKSTINHLATFFPDIIAGTSTRLPIYLPGTRYYKGCSARSKMLALILPIMTQRRQEMSGQPPPKPESGRPQRKLKDVLSVLISAKDEHSEPLSDTIILDNLLTLLFASRDTTISTICMACKFLASNPACYEQVLQEQLDIAKLKRDGEPLSMEDVLKMNYTWMVVQETLRLQPNCVLTFKVALKDFEFKGFKIPCGWKVMHYLVSGNLDEECFLNPHKFDPSRFMEDNLTRYNFLPFGGGSHICVGIQFARIAILVFIHYLIRKVKWNIVDPNELFFMDPFPTPSNGFLLSVKETQTHVQT